jgi:hypothetical protein
MRKLVAAVSAVAALVAASPASAHFIVVTPPGRGETTVVDHHVGQGLPDHNSCFGLSSADSHEQSAAVNFLGPPPAACPP